MSDVLKLSKEVLKPEVYSPVNPKKSNLAKEVLLKVIDDELGFLDKFALNKCFTEIQERIELLNKCKEILKC